MGNVVMGRLKDISISRVDKVKLLDFCISVLDVLEEDLEYYYFDTPKQKVMKSKILDLSNSLGVESSDMFLNDVSDWLVLEYLPICEGEGAISYYRRVIRNLKLDFIL